MARTKQTANKLAARKTMHPKNKKIGIPAAAAAAAVIGEPQKRPHRFRPGTVALREIRKYQ